MTDLRAANRAVFSWSQPCCARCWFSANPDWAPVRLKEPEVEVCVDCGHPTYDGIMIRIDPAEAAFPTHLKYE